MTKVKICGLFREEDVAAVNESKPDYCGFIINFPKSHRNISEIEVRELTKMLDKNIIRVGVIVNQPEKFASYLINQDVVDIVQLHGMEDNGYIRKLRGLINPEKLEKAQIWKAFKIRSKEDMERANDSLADMIVLDNGYGTGEVFDWNLIEAKREFMLAGGLTPENIPDAIHQIHPTGIDISSGVETEKKKDKDKILAAVQACRKES